MLIHRDNVLKAHQHNHMIVFYTKRTLKKNNFNTKSDQNIHQDAPNCTFFQKFLAGYHAPS